uniref:Ocs element-binding factor 1 n=1 Tax=Anthurium amnicola TaxID=1678845 RepID=A0A1D1Z2Z7_9ARAE
MPPPAMAKPASSGSSDSDPAAGIDQRKRRRMESNRDSARRSRLRKQQHLEGQVAQMGNLKGENDRLAAQVAAFEQQLAELDGENAALGAQVAELSERLRSLNSVLRFVQDFSGMAMDIPEMPDPLLRPWQLPRPSHPINMSQC